MEMRACLHISRHSGELLCPGHCVAGDSVGCRHFPLVKGRAAACVCMHVGWRMAGGPWGPDPALTLPPKFCLRQHTSAALPAVAPSWPLQTLYLTHPAEGLGGLEVSGKRDICSMAWGYASAPYMGLLKSSYFSDSSSPGKVDRGQEGDRIVTELLLWRRPLPGLDTPHLWLQVPLPPTQHQLFATPIKHTASPLRFVFQRIGPKVLHSQPGNLMLQFHTNCNSLLMVPFGRADPAQSRQ